MSTPTHVAVVIPARDEEALLPACLDSVVRAIAAVGDTNPGVTCHTFVVLDDCRDGTTAIVAGRTGVTGIRVQLRLVGAARAVGVTVAATWAGSGVDLWIANTDADTVVADDWLTQQLAMATAGIDLVVGTVRPNPLDLSDLELERWDQHHTPGDGHHHIHAANLGFSLAAYLAAGGFPHLPVHEDVELVRTMQASGIEWLASGSIAAVTSGRRTGRAPHGFAAYVDGLGA